MEDDYFHIPSGSVKRSGLLTSLWRRGGGGVRRGMGRQLEALSFVEERKPPADHEPWRQMAWWRWRKTAVGECLDQEHRIGNGPGPSKD